MIDSPDSSRPKGDQKGEAGLEEARLRQQAIGVLLRVPGQYKVTVAYGAGILNDCRQLMTKLLQRHMH